MKKELPDVPTYFDNKRYPRLVQVFDCDAEGWRLKATDRRTALVLRAIGSCAMAQLLLGEGEREFCCDGWTKDKFAALSSEEGVVFEEGEPFDYLDQLMLALSSPDQGMQLVMELCRKKLKRKKRKHVLVSGKKIPIELSSL